MSVLSAESLYICMKITYICHSGWASYLFSRLCNQNVLLFVEVTFFFIGISNPTSSHHQFNIVPRVKWEFDPKAWTEVSIQQWFDYHIIISRLRRRTLSVCWTITSSVYTVTCLIHSYLFCLNVWPFVNLLQTICFTASLKTILIFLTAFSFKPNYYF